MFKRRQRKYSMSLFSRFIRKILEDEFRSFKHSRRNASLVDSSASPSPIPNQINSKPEESENTAKILSELKFLKKKTIENNLLLKELMNKVNVRPSFTAPQESTSIRTIPCPANTVEELNAICQMENLKGYLYNMRSTTLSKTITAILKALMTRQLAIQFSMSGLDVKRKHTKLKFQGTPACFLVEGVLSMLPEYAGESLTTIYRHIGIVLKNSHDWEGYRRRPSKKSSLMNSDMSFEDVNDAETILLDNAHTVSKMMENDESSAEVMSEISKSVENILDEEKSIQPKDVNNQSGDQLTNFEIQFAMNIQNDVTIKDEIVNCDSLFKSTVDDSHEMYEDASVNVSKDKINIVFSCHICDKLFMTRDQLKNHMKVEHS